MAVLTEDSVEVTVRITRVGGVVTVGVDGTSLAGGARVRSIRRDITASLTGPQITTATNVLTFCEGSLKSFWGIS